MRIYDHIEGGRTLANKNARIIWAAMAKGIAFDANQVSVKPEPASMAAAL